jgi:hypothetical protein
MVGRFYQADSGFGDRLIKELGISKANVEATFKK